MQPGFHTMFYVINMAPRLRGRKQKKSDRGRDTAPYYKKTKETKIRTNNQTNMASINPVTVDCSQHLYYSSHAEEIQAKRAQSTLGWGLRKQANHVKSPGPGCLKGV